MTQQGHLVFEGGAVEMNDSIERPLKAVAIVLAVVLVTPGVDAIVRYVGSSGVRSASASSLDADSVVGGLDAEGAIDRLEKAAAVEECEVPPVYESEIGMLPDAQDVRVNEDGSVVGYVVDGSADEVFTRLSSHMESRGWVSVDLGQENSATFVKSSGSCTWALVTCTEVGLATSVVTRCVVS